MMCVSPSYYVEHVANVEATKNTLASSPLPSIQQPYQMSRTAIHISVSMTTALYAVLEQTDMVGGK